MLPRLPRRSPRPRRRCRYDGSGNEVVTAQAVQPRKPAEAAAECETTGSSVRDDAGRSDGTETLSRTVEVAEERAALHRRSSPVVVDGRPAHRAEVDDQPAVHTECPATLCPPHRTAISRLSSRAALMLAVTSAVVAQRAMSAGLRSIIAFHTARAASYVASSGLMTSPSNPLRSRSATTVTSREASHSGPCGERSPAPFV